MGEEWIKECNEYLALIKESMDVGSPDRLALVRSMHRALLALNHSILGWFQYVNNPDIMSMFDIDELTGISGNLNKFAEEFIEHDIEITQKGIKKGLEDTKEEGERQPFYV